MQDIDKLALDSLCSRLDALQVVYYVRLWRGIFIDQSSNDREFREAPKVPIL